MAALVATAVLLSVVWLGWEGRAESPDAADLGTTPLPEASPEAEGAVGPISGTPSNDEGRCYCLAIPGPLQPRFEARLVRDGVLLTTIGLVDGGNHSLVGRATLSDRQATAAVLDLTWNDVQQDGGSQVLARLDLEQRYARRFVPRQFRGELNLGSQPDGPTSWQYAVLRSRSEGGVVLSIEIEPLPATSVEDTGERPVEVGPVRRPGPRHPKQ